MRAPSRFSTPPTRFSAPPKKAEPFYLSKAWRKLVAEIKVERGDRCERCGSDHRVIGDHIVELKDGGAPLDPSNIELLCQACHNGKTAKARKARVQGGGVAGNGIAGPMSHPSWFRAVHVPLTIVCGPPGAGKTTWVRERAASADLVICMDTLAREHFGGDRRVVLDGDDVGDVLRLRNELLGDLMRREARKRWPHAWLIALEPEAKWRAWWQNALRPERVIVLATPAAECKRRVEADAARGDVRTEAVGALIDRWWSLYTPRAGDILAA